MSLQQEFLQWFNEAYGTGLSREKAYYEAEKKFKKKYKHNKYSGYNSFNVTQCRKVKLLTSKE